MQTWLKLREELKDKPHYVHVIHKESFSDVYSTTVLGIKVGVSMVASGRG